MNSFTASLVASLDRRFISGSKELPSFEEARRVSKRTEIAKHARFESVSRRVTVIVRGLLVFRANISRKRILGVRSFDRIAIDRRLFLSRKDIALPGDKRDPREDYLTITIGTVGIVRFDREFVISRIIDRS